MSEQWSPLTAKELDMLRRLDGPEPFDIVKVSRVVAEFAVRAVREIERWRSEPLRMEPETVTALKQRLHAAHAELERRRSRDVEIAAHVPALAARLHVIAEDIKLDAAPTDDAWWRDQEIDWTGIEK